MSREARRSWRSVPLKRVYDYIATIVLVGLILVTLTRLTLLQGDILETPTMEGQGSALRQGLYVLGAVLMLLVARPISRPGKVFDLPGSMLLLLALCLVSVCWSATPSIAVRRLVLAAIVIWLAFRTVDALGHRKSMSVMLYVLVMLLIVNLVAVAVTPLAVHHGEGVLEDVSVIGAWRGVLVEKNSAGVATAITILLLVFGGGRFHLATRVPLIVAAGIFLAGTQSKTSLGLLVLAILVGGAFRFSNPRYRGLLIPLLAISVAGLVFFLTAYLPSYLDSLARSPNAFTGRIDIWRPVVAYCQDHFWTGAGFGSFWDVGSVGPINSYSNAHWIVSLVTTAHNGYLDVASQIGVPGMVFAVIALFIIPIIKLTASGSTPRDAGALSLALIIFMMAHNITESSMLAPDAFGEAIIMLAIACVSNMLRATPPADALLAGGRKVRRQSPDILSAAAAISERALE